MTARILSGKTIADAIKAEVANEVAAIREVHGFAPRLIVVRVGDDPASAVLLSHVAYNHYLNDQLDSAMIVIRLALDIDPLNYTSLANGALIYIKANRLEQARALDRE